MGVDIAAYRARIGTYIHSFGQDVVTHDVFVDMPLFWRIIILEMLCVLSIIITLIEAKCIFKKPYEFTTTIHDNWHAADYLMPLTLTYILEVIGYSLLLTAALPGLHSTKTGISFTYGSRKDTCNSSKMNVHRCFMSAKSTSVLCAIGTLSFIGMLLLMAGVEPNPGPNGGAKNTCRDSSNGNAVLKRLGLDEYFPGKIELFDVISIFSEDIVSFKGRSDTNLPWKLLRQLIFVNDNAFCLDDTATEVQTSESESDESSSDEEDGTNESGQRLNYLDVFLLVYQCCSPMLQQILFQKMFLCKFAVPFLFTPLTKTKPRVSMWPLRSLVVESCSTDNRTLEYNILDLPVKCVAFCRLGRPMFSKSQLLNIFVSDNSSKTFSNLKCQSGNVLKSFCIGYIESFWLLRAGDRNDTFEDTTMIFNMRGCVRSFDEQTMKFMSIMVDTISVFIEKDKLIDYKSNLEDMTSLFKSVIIVVIGSMKGNKDFESGLTTYANERNHNISFVKTYDKKYAKLQSEEKIKNKVVEAIKKQTQHKNAKSFETRMQECEVQMCTDEQTEECEYGKTMALRFCKLVNLDSSFLSLKENVTPIHSKFAEQLGTLLKEIKRAKDIKVQGTKREEINKLRDEMKYKITEPMKQILKVFCEQTSLNGIEFYLAWLGFYISRRSRSHLSELKVRHQIAWETFRQQQQKRSIHDEAEDDTCIRQIESEMDDASFSVGLIFREIGMIYDTLSQLNPHTIECINIPPVKTVASVIGKLVAKGRRFEIIDGESFFFPNRWLSEVFDSLHKAIQSGKVMTLSVLGIQSSGKSTLLNTMFGALFSTSTGRCTRGIHAQLIPIHKDVLSRGVSDYQYVLILDTEGLRPTEINHESHEHDNELATFITGLGNTTVVNVMGENTQEIRDILQIVAHAFLRIRLANKNITLQNRCIMVQQNITAIVARDNMNKGLQTFIKSLDEMTEKSAKGEGVHDIRSFNEVINFDISSDVFYLKNVWHGNPPFARVNLDYSEAASKIKIHIFKQFSKVHKSHYSTLQSFIVQAHDLWQGVLHENFVFSFKNSLERIAYLQMDEHIQGQMWEIERFVTGETKTITQKEYSNCQTLENIDISTKNIDDRISKMIIEKELEADKFLTAYFDESDRRSIIAQWEENQRSVIRRFFDKLRGMYEIERQCERDKCMRNFRIHSSQKRNEEALQKKTLDYTQTHRVKDTPRAVVTQLFEDFWKDTYGTLDPSKKANEYGLKQHFYNCLYDKLAIQKQILDRVLREMDWWGENTKVHSLNFLNFENSGIDHDDISTSMLQGVAEMWSNRRKTAIDSCETFVQSLYGDITTKIEEICAENDQITEAHVRKLIRYLSDIYREKKSNQGVKFKEKMYVKIAVHVSIVANDKFEEHNKRYWKALVENFESLKRQQELLFENCFELRKSEDTVAEIITEVIDMFIGRECVYQCLARDLRDTLVGKLPSNKNKLIVEMLTNMVDVGNFEWILSYVMHSEIAAEKWLIDKANKILFKKDQNQFLECSLRVIDVFHLKVKKSVASLKTTGEEMISLNSLINSLRSNLAKEEIFIPEIKFKSVYGCMCSIINLSVVRDAVDVKLKPLIDRRKQVFSSHTKDTVEWLKYSPVQEMFKARWGCSESCPYCLEPCEKSNESHEGDHTCVQHRPRCCRGTFWEDTKQAVCETCCYAIFNNCSHYCENFNCECNKPTRTKCGKGIHRFRDYKEFLTNWQIPSSSDMYETSKFWLWFCGAFKGEIATAFGIRTDDIPAEWSQISSAEAKASLQTTYMPS